MDGKRLTADKIVPSEHYNTFNIFKYEKMMYGNPIYTLDNDSVIVDDTGMIDLELHINNQVNTVSFNIQDVINLG